MNAPTILGIVSYKIFPAQMGGQKCVTEWYTHLALEAKVILAVSKENGQVENMGYPILPFLYNHWWGILNIRYLYELNKLIKEQAIDVIIIEHSYFGWLGLLLRWFTKKPFIIRSHNIEAHRFRDMQRNWWRLYGWYEKQVHQKADHSFFITPEDKVWAVSHWQLDESKCTVITHGTDILQVPLTEEKKIYRQQLLSENNVNPGTRLFLFNGSLNYLPNIDALRIIISELLPILQSMHFEFRILICGKGLTKQWEQLLYAYPQLIYKGYVQNIAQYFRGTDCFINPVTLGGGIKIKLVEALAQNQPVISTRTGAKGIPANLLDEKIVLVDDYNWQAFAKAMSGIKIHDYTNTPAAFYREFNWDKIVQKALLSLQKL